jgi:putative RNA 2'-phosphotransferase
MNAEQTKRISKFLSLVLRHQPQLIGLELSPAGWVAIDELLAAAAQHGRRMTREELDEVVRSNDKQRFAISDDGLHIRANQGHSVEVDLGYTPADPPEVLYHGTTEQFLDSIRRTGLHKRKRHHVHLSLSVETATAVGGRRGKPTILTIRAGAMQAAGHKFFVTPNGVWLTNEVPPEYIEFPRDV